MKVTRTLLKLLVKRLSSGDKGSLKVRLAQKLADRIQPRNASGNNMSMR
jgi:hypothetical protein